MAAHGATLLHRALGCGDQDQNSHDPQRILGQNGEAHGAALSPVAAGLQRLQPRDVTLRECPREHHTCSFYLLPESTPYCSYHLAR